MKSLGNQRDGRIAGPLLLRYGQAVATRLDELLGNRDLLLSQIGSFSEE